MCYGFVITLKTRMTQLHIQRTTELRRHRRIILFNYLPLRPAEIYTPLPPPNFQGQGLGHNGLPIVRTHPLKPVVWQ